MAGLVRIDISCKDLKLILQLGTEEMKVLSKLVICILKGHRQQEEAKE